MKRPKRLGSFSLKDERQLITMAKAGATIEQAAAKVRRTQLSIERKASVLGITFSGAKQLGLKAKCN